MSQIFDGFRKVIIFFKRFYLFMRDKQREAETQAEGAAGSLQGAWCGTRSQDPGIMPWAEGRHLTTEPPRCPYNFISFKHMLTFFLINLNHCVIIENDLIRWNKYFNCTWVLVLIDFPSVYHKYPKYNKAKILKHNNQRWKLKAVLTINLRE